jgi:hypothetical protein
MIPWDAILGTIVGSGILIILIVLWYIYFYKD